MTTRTRPTAKPSNAPKSRKTANRMQASPPAQDVVVTPVTATAQDSITATPAIATQTETVPVAQTATADYTGSPAAAQTTTLAYPFPAVGQQPLTVWERTMLALYKGGNLAPREAWDIFDVANPFVSHSDGLQKLMQVLYDQIPTGLVFEPRQKGGLLSAYRSWYSPRLKMLIHWRDEKLYFGSRSHPPDHVFYWLYMGQPGSQPQRIIHTCVRPGFNSQASTIWTAGKYNQGLYNNTRNLVQNSFALPVNPLAARFRQLFGELDTPMAAFRELWDELHQQWVSKDRYLSQFAQDFLRWRCPDWTSEVGIFCNWAFVMCHSQPELLELAQAWQAEAAVDCDFRAVVQNIRERAATLINNRIPIGPFALAQTKDHSGS